jgi:hypothetical protein
MAGREGRPGIAKWLCFNPRAQVGHVPDSMGVAGFMEAQCRQYVEKYLTHTQLHYLPNILLHSSSHPLIKTQNYTLIIWGLYVLFSTSLKERYPLSSPNAAVGP